MFANLSLGVYEKLEGSVGEMLPTTPPSAFPSKVARIKNMFNEFTVHFVSASFLLPLVERMWIGSSAKHFQRIQSQSRCHLIEM